MSLDLFCNAFILLDICCELELNSALIVYGSDFLFIKDLREGIAIGFGRPPIELGGLNSSSLSESKLLFSIGAFFYTETPNN